ncbi:acyl-CoA synthetase short-chain family member 3, mitochondrial-like isoform X2 [Ornithodoros turicata]|uniref:acyl-CoA synthetase short-chain family member 3, mitochondrial-like isoform X2 n=1 Tax=Ornithodoros turicata TaxID=34597 RepID=UPI003138AB74
MLGSGGGPLSVRVLPAIGFALTRRSHHNAVSKGSCQKTWRRIFRVDPTKCARDRRYHHTAAFRRSVGPAHLTNPWCYLPAMRFRSQALYDDVFRQSIEGSREFWAQKAAYLAWDTKWDMILDDRDVFFPKWFAGGKISVCYNAVDRHVEAGLGERVAIIHDSPVTNSITKITYSELQKQVSQVAGVLHEWGVQKGDRVIIYMPMIPESIYGMLACSRIGAVHSLVFGGFSAQELAVRISHAQAVVCLSANFGIEPKRTVPYKDILDDAINMSQHKPKKCLIFERPGQETIPMTKGRDEFWREATARARPVGCTAIDATDPLYLIYTSGTTGVPKAIVRPAGGHAVNLLYTMHSVYGIREGDTWWAASDLGWVVGHSYICYGPLLKGITTVLYEGKPVGTPDVSSYFRVIDQHGVSGMFSAPTAVRIIRKEDPNCQTSKKYGMEKLRYVFLAGERCDIETLKWAQRAFRVPALDHWWQTETGSPLTATCVGLGNPLKVPDEATGLPVPGWDVRVLLDDGLEAAPLQMGNVAVKLPLPPGALSTLYKADDVFIEKYFTKFPGYYDTMDTGMVHQNGYISIFSRNDDVINVAGHRLSTSQIEEAQLLTLKTCARSWSKS